MSFRMVSVAQLAAKIMDVCFGLAPIDLGTIASDVPPANVIRRLEAMPAWRRPDLTRNMRWDSAVRRLRAVSPQRLGTMRDQAFITVEAVGMGSSVHALQVPNGADAALVVAMSACAVLSVTGLLVDPARGLIGVVALCFIRLLMVPASRRADTRRFKVLLSVACDARLELPPSPPLPGVRTRRDVEMREQECRMHGRTAWRLRPRERLTRLPGAFLALSIFVPVVMAMAGIQALVGAAGHSRRVFLGLLLSAAAALCVWLEILYLRRPRLPR